MKITVKQIEQVLNDASKYSKLTESKQGLWVGALKDIFVNKRAFVSFLTATKSAEGSAIGTQLADNIYEFFDGRDGSDDDKFNPFVSQEKGRAPVVLEASQKNLDAVYKNLAQDIFDKYFSDEPPLQTDGESAALTSAAGKPYIAI